MMGGEGRDGWSAKDFAENTFTTKIREKQPKRRVSDCIAATCMIHINNSTACQGEALPSRQCRQPPRFPGWSNHTLCEVLSIVVEERPVALLTEERGVGKCLNPRGLVCVCLNRKSIKDPRGGWRPIEQYLIRHPEADFSHGICPECMKKLYAGES